MIFTLEHPAPALAILLVILVSLLAVESARRYRLHGQITRRAYLYGGGTALFGIASNAGALFSLTYFFGGAAIYGFLFAGWYLVIAAVVMTSAIVMLLVISRRIGGDAPNQNSNVLLSYLQKSLGVKEFHLACRIYVISYVLLLIEELAISRLVVSQIVDGNALLTALVMVVILFTIYSYLFLGGFRAVIVSDFYQMLVVAAFLVLLVFLIAKTGLPADAWSTRSGSSSDLSNLIFSIIFGICWFVGGIDYYSRLNFAYDKNLPARKQQQRFIILSGAAATLVLCIGILFGIHLRDVLSSIDSPERYCHDVVQYFLSSDRIIVPPLFLASIFCMLFTTIDTLLLTVLQIGFYYRSDKLSRESLSRLFLLLVLGSALIDFDMVSAFGIYAGSVMIIPATLSLRTIFPSLRAIVGGSDRIFEYALGLSAVFFVLTFKVLELQFEYHFLIPGFVVISILLCSLASRVLQQYSQRRA